MTAQHYLGNLSDDGLLLHPLALGSGNTLAEGRFGANVMVSRFSRLVTRCAIYTDVWNPLPYTW